MKPNAKEIIRKALADAHVTQLEAYVLVMEIFTEEQEKQNGN